MLKVKACSLGRIYEPDGFSGCWTSTESQCLDLCVFTDGHHVLALLAVLSPSGTDSAFFPQLGKVFHHSLPLGLIPFSDESGSQVVIGSHVIRRKLHHLAQKCFGLVVILLLQINLAYLIEDLRVLRIGR